MRESKVKKILIRLSSIALVLMLSLGMTACSCSRKDVGNTEETTINIITEKDSSGSNQGEDIAPKTQQIGNAKVEGNIIGIGRDVTDERYKAIIEKEMGFDNPAPQNSIWTEYYSPTLNQTLLINTNKVSGGRNIYDTQGTMIAWADKSVKDEPVEKTLQSMVMGWDIADAIDRRYGGK